MQNPTSPPPHDRPAPLLQTKNLHVTYGTAPVLHGLSLTIAPQQIIGILGPNGAGKTTTLATIAGLLHPYQGTLTFHGHDITHTTTPQRVRNGIVLVPEGRGIFGSLTVLENLRMGAYLSRFNAKFRRDLNTMLDLFPPLRARLSLPASVLSGGESQMLALIRALLSQPRLLLLDEPSHGLAPITRDQAFGAISSIVHDKHITCIIVEQDATKALQVADYIYVLDNGTVLLEGPTAAMREHPIIRQRYHVH